MPNTKDELLAHLDLFDQISVPVVIEEILPLDDGIEKDLEYARKKQLDIIKAGQENLSGIVAVASQSQHPRAYEVLGLYMKTLSELNKDFISIAERRNFGKEEEEAKVPQVTNQLFVGSTAEFAAMLKTIKND